MRVRPISTAWHTGGSSACIIVLDLKEARTPKSPRGSERPMKTFANREGGIKPRSALTCSEVFSADWARIMHWGGRGCVNGKRMSGKGWDVKGWGLNELTNSQTVVNVPDFFVVT